MPFHQKTAEMGKYTLTERTQNILLAELLPQQNHMPGLSTRAVNADSCLPGSLTRILKTLLHKQKGEIYHDEKDFWKSNYETRRR